MISQALFILLLSAASFFAYRRFSFVRRNILLGQPTKSVDNAKMRWSTMARVALGQGKMFSRPFVAIMHLFLYVGFVVINIEVLEIVLDGVTGSHRILAALGVFYDYLIGSFEVLAALVLLACVVFLARRNTLRIKRFWMREMTAWPRTDANIILVAEILLMSAFLTMNASDFMLQSRGIDHYVEAGSFPISQVLLPVLENFSDASLVLIERGCWWFHIIGILVFIVYVTYSKHLHIILAFPNTYYSKLVPAGTLGNLQSVTNEVKMMLDPSIPPPPADAAPNRFGVKDVFDLSWVNLMNAYSCTECGRCTTECPANQTGKLLSPRKIMMDTRDRLEEVGRCIDANKGQWSDDGKSLLRDYISEEELWACTTCNACTQACPVNINPLEIIVDLRRYLIMEESKSPESITTMFNNIENNGAPWAMSAADRANWTNN